MLTAMLTPYRLAPPQVSIGSDAVLVAEEYYAGGKVKTGKTSIEQISRVYGKQAVVVSIDPRRVWVKSPEDVKHHCVKASRCMERAGDRAGIAGAWRGWVTKATAIADGRMRFLCAAPVGLMGRSTAGGSARSRGAARGGTLGPWSWQR